MKSLLPYQGDHISSEIFTKCFISSNNLSNSLFPRFVCTIWNKSPEGMLNMRGCWRFDFYADNPIKAMEKGYLFLIKNNEKNFNMTESECLKLRNELNS